MKIILCLMEMSVSAGILIGFVLILRKLTQAKLPKMMFLLLWDIVTIRLLLPFTIPSKISWLSIFGSLINKSDTQSLKNLNTPIFSENKFTNHVPNNYSRTILLVIWFIGVVCCLSYFLCYYYKSYRKIRESLPLTNTTYINHLLEELPLKRKILIRTSDHITTPITYGLFKPKIVLPTFISTENTIQLKHIITHEYIHIKRFDCIRKWLSILAVCIHWFNPFVWLMYFRFNDDLEIVCDAQVIKLLGDGEKEPYANSLIQLAVQQQHTSTLYQGFGKSAVKERIVYIMKFNKTTTFGIGCAALLFIASTTVFASTSGFGKESSSTNAEKLTEVSVNTDDSNKDFLRKKEENKDNKDSKVTFKSEESEKSEYPITIKKKNDEIQVSIKEAKNTKPENEILYSTEVSSDARESAATVDKSSLVEEKKSETLKKDEVAADKAKSVNKLIPSSETYDK